MENPRRLERERVLSLLYEAEMKGQTVDELLAELPTQPERFVVDLMKGVDAAAVALDAEISARATNWDIDRIAAIDRLIMRIGVWELQNRPDLPIAVVISEAVELAKTFSTDESGKFVNGVLSAVSSHRKASS